MGKIGNAIAISTEFLIQKKKQKYIPAIFMNPYVFGNVEYCFDRRAKKWSFTILNLNRGKFTMFKHCPGGKLTADQIAAELNGNPPDESASDPITAEVRIKIENLVSI